MILTNIPHLTRLHRVFSYHSCCFMSHGSALTSQDVALPIVAAEMALQCGAKKLILNHIGCQFLPTKINTVKSKHPDVRWDSELLLEVSERASYLLFPLARPNANILSIRHRTLSDGQMMYW
jgi:hypothetical protein